MITPEESFDPWTAPIEELLEDLVESILDVRDCKEALRQGVTVYGDGQSVQERLDVNQKIIALVQGIVSERAEGGKMSKFNIQTASLAELTRMYKDTKSNTNTLRNAIRCGVDTYSGGTDPCELEEANAAIRKAITAERRRRKNVQED